MALKYSRQREAIWNFLKGRTDHPTADTVYTCVRREYPNISLGTVYRNLMLLRDLGSLQTVEVGDGTIHFDPNTTDHDHFYCTKCGSVTDIFSTDHVRIRAEAVAGYAGRIEGYHAFFHGICEKCLQESRP